MVHFIHTTHIHIPMKFSFPNDKGALPYQTILQMVRAGFISGAEDKNIRPASLDLSLSSEIYKVEGVFQPRAGETVRDVLKKIKKEKFSLDKPLVREQMYIARLNEKIELPRSIYAYCNPKSTSGRVDVHVRLIADGVSRYDALTPGYKGELWVSLVPKTFSVKMYEGLSLNQLRFFNSDTRLNELEIELASRQYNLLWSLNKARSFKFDELKIKDGDGSLILTLDLGGKVLGYEGIPSAEVLDLKNVGFYDSKKFFKPVSMKGDFLYLKKGSFYILSTNEAVRVPPELACEMVPMDEKSGEFRSHYAGFIDPGWGWGVKAEGKGRALTLEVRPFEDLIVRHNQPIAKIKFEKMTEVPQVVYDEVSSNYVKQVGPKLSKHFR